jgi:hypothetical protein
LGGGQWGETAQTMYAHMNKWIKGKKISKKKKDSIQDGHGGACL